MARNKILIFGLLNSDSRLESATQTKWDVREITGRGEKCCTKIEESNFICMFFVYVEISYERNLRCLILSLIVN